MKRLLSITVFLFAFMALPYISNAGSGIGFPQGWEKWTPVNTTLVQIGALPGCDADVKTLPPIYQETVATYCSVRAGGPGKVGVLVNPSALPVYGARSGKFGDGANAILHLKEMKVLFVTGHKGGEAVYGIYSEDGKDISAPEGPLSTQTCVACHTGYQAFCIKGQCGKVIK